MGRILEADIESFSDVDLVKCGVYAYADSPAFEIIYRKTTSPIWNWQETL